jgi:ribosomal protein S18 acetylase RimI-like enzyme
MSLSLAAFSMDDYAEVMALWHTIEGVGLSAADQPERIAAYLARNPGMSLVAREDGALVGAALCGHDGRRGYLHHLAVRPDRRGRGIGRELVAGCLAALAAEGIDKCHLFVFKDNLEGQAFWRKLGWQERLDLMVMSKKIG